MQANHLQPESEADRLLMKEKPRSLTNIKQRAVRGAATSSNTHRANAIHKVRASVKRTPPGELAKPSKAEKLERAERLEASHNGGTFDIGKSRNEAVKSELKLPDI